MTLQLHLGLLILTKPSPQVAGGYSSITQQTFGWSYRVSGVVSAAELRRRWAIHVCYQHRDIHPKTTNFGSGARSVYEIFYRRYRPNKGTQWLQSRAIADRNIS